MEGLAFVAVKQRVILLLILTAGMLWIRRQRADDVVSGLCEKTVGSGAGRGGLPLVRPWESDCSLMSIVLLWCTERTLADRVNIIVWTSAVSGLAIVVLVWTKDLYLVSLLMIVIGGGMGAFTPIAWGIVQELTPRMMVGRVLGLYGTGAMTAAISGISMFGQVTERFGESAGIAGIGATFLLTASLGGWLSRSIRNR